MNYKKLLLVYSVLLVIGGGCAREPEKRVADKVEKVTIAINKSDITSLVMLAKEKGYFRDQGLEVILEDYPSGRQAVKALKAGATDIATASEYALVSQSFSNPSIKAIGTVSIYQNKTIVVRKDRDIRHPGDLKGKRVGVPRKTGGELYLGNFLAMNRMNVQDVIVVDVKANELARAMISGDVDACSVWDPYAYKIKKALGDNAHVLKMAVDQTYYFLLLAEDDWIQSNSTVITKMLRGLIQAEEFIKVNPDKMRGYMHATLKYDLDYIDYMLPKIVFKVELPQSMLAVMENEARWRVANHLEKSTGIPNYLNHIYFDGLENVNPETVTIIH